MNFFKITLFFVLVSFTTNTYSQISTKQELINKALKNDNIETQFEVLIENSPTFQQFKNIKLFNLAKYKANFLDSLKTFDEKYRLANDQIAKQHNEIERLKTEITAINTNLAAANDEKDKIDLFGIQTTKAAYNMVLWSIILGLLATTFVFLFKFKRSHFLTKEARGLFNSIEEEFETHKKKSLEREQVLRRKLQDEINKQRNA